MSKEEFKVTHTINIPRETINCAECKRYGEQTCVPYGLSCQYEPIIPHRTVRISQKHINNINKIVKELQKENQKLNKQLKEYKRLGFKHLNDKCNKLENQQKEFIEYLEKTIVDSKAGSGQQYYFQEILSNYKEIMEVNSENNKQ